MVSQRQNPASGRSLTAAQSPVEIDVFHLGHVSDQAKDRQLDRRNGPPGQLLIAEVAQLALELVTLVVEPIDQERAQVGVGRRLGRRAKVEAGRDG